MEIAMLDTVIFDLDGTLLNTLDDLFDSVNVILNKYNFPLRTKDEVRMFVGNGVPKLIERALPKSHTKETFDAALADFKSYYGKHCNDKTQPYDGVMDALMHLKSNGYKIAVVSNKVDFATKSLCRDYFGNLVDVAIGQREGIEKKPAPDSVFEAMKLLDSKNAVYVGDSDVDIMTAKNAGLPCIAVTWGFRDKEFLFLNGGRIFANDTNEMISIIEKM